MKSLIPIPSDSIEPNIEILVDPSQLAYNYGYSGAFRVLKTAISTSCNEWELQIVTGNNIRTIFSSAQIEKDKHNKPFDIPKLIGHGLSIMPWQKLRVQFNNGYGSAISYIEDNL